MDLNQPLAYRMSPKTLDDYVAVTAGPMPKPQQHQIWASSATHTTAL